MPETPFDDLTRLIVCSKSRRALGRLAAGSIVAATISRAFPVTRTEAKRNRVREEHNIRGNKAIMCYRGETIRVPKNRRKKWLKRGATRGTCPGTCTPVCQPGSCGAADGCGGSCGCAGAEICYQDTCCTPTCTGCGADNGCGGICSCAADEICDNGTCQVCTVDCTGTPAECGAALAGALAVPGTVYVCPGIYQGTFDVGNNSLIGAGSGEDETANTILDGNDLGITVTISSAATATIANVRVTGGSNPSGTGGGILSDSGATLTVEDCVVTGNQAGDGGGISVEVGSLTMTNSVVSGNIAEDAAGVACNNSTCTFVDSEISSNTATVTVGGGLTVYTGALNFQNTVVTGNSAAQNGGGVLIGNGGATATFDSASAVTNNTANTSGFGFSGGGVFNGYGGTLNLNGATLSGNLPDNCVGTGC